METAGWPSRRDQTEPEQEIKAELMCFGAFMSRVLFFYSVLELSFPPKFRFSLLWNFWNKRIRRVFFLKGPQNKKNPPTRNPSLRSGVAWEPFPQER